jgi:conjugal transfer pilus assembly protein TraL
MSALPLPRAIDDPPYILLFRLDDLAPAAAVIVAGYLADALLPSLVVAVAAAWLYQRVRAGRPEGFVQHWLWFWGLYPNQGYSFRNPYRREYRP